MFFYDETNITMKEEGKTFLISKGISKINRFDSMIVEGINMKQNIFDNYNDMTTEQRIRFLNYMIRLVELDSQMFEVQRKILMEIKQLEKN